MRALKSTIMWQPWMLKNRSAFTLVESLLVLAVTTAILGIGVQTFKVTRERQAEAQFFETLVSLFERAKMHTMLGRLVTEINIDDRKVVYKETYHQPQTIKMPSTLSVTKTSPKILIIKDEMIAPRRIVLTSSLGEEYAIKPQLGWGIIHIEKLKR